jgi:hypothetical protein
MTRVVLGAISGLILANFGTYLIGTDTTLKTLAPSALALVGGYSADAVNSILKRFADTVTAAVRGSGEDVVKASEAQFAARQAQMEAETKSNNLQIRQATLSVLSQIVSGASGDTRAQLEAVMAAIGKGSDLSNNAVLNLTGFKNPSTSNGVSNGKSSNGSATANVLIQPHENGTTTAGTTIDQPATVSPVLSTTNKPDLPGALIESSQKEPEPDTSVSPTQLTANPAEPAPVAPPTNGKREPGESDS